MSLSLLVSLSLIGLSIAFVIFTHSRNQVQTWQPVRVEEKHLIYPSSMINEAHDWYTSSKQERNALDALVKTCYAIACMRAVQSSCSLDEVANIALPDSITPATLMTNIATQQSLLITAIRANLAANEPVFDNFTK